jgi:hypothetical protein
VSAGTRRYGFGIDNHNHYYDPTIKKVLHANSPNDTNLRIKLADHQAIEAVLPLISSNG